jgi:hypothetical protein
LQHYPIEHGDAKALTAEFQLHENFWQDGDADHQSQQGIEGQQDAHKRE